LGSQDDFASPCLRKTFRFFLKVFLDSYGRKIRAGKTMLGMVRFDAQISKKKRITAGMRAAPIWLDGDEDRIDLR